MSLGESITLAELEADPYPALARLRADEPVSFVPDLDMWLVTRWDDVEFVNAHPELFTSATEPSWLNTVLGRNMLGTDGEEHRRLKDALQPTFSPSAAGIVDAARDCRCCATSCSTGSTRPVPT